MSEKNDFKIRVLLNFLEKLMLFSFLRFNQFLVVIFLFLLYFPFQSCFSQDFKINLLQGCSEKNEKYPEPPYFVKFEKKKKKLLYIAARHEIGTNNQTAKLIRQVFIDYHPKIVIIEGFQPNSVNEALEEEIKSCQPKNFKDCGESILSGYLAKKNGAHIVTGEPSDQIIFDELLKKGYSAEDYLGFYLLRQIPQWKREHKIDNNLEWISNLFLKTCLENVKEEGNFDFERFKIWHKDKMNYPFTLDKHNEHTVAPKSHLFMHNLWLTIERIREENILKTIEKAISQHDIVLIVYGASHFTVEKNVLTHFFGSPEVTIGPSDRATTRHYGYDEELD